VTNETEAQELARLRTRVRQLEAELNALEGVEAPRELDEGSAAASNSHADWSSGYYAVYQATAGFLLGMFAAALSLLVNVIGAPLAGRHPLELIRVYLTFPLGEQALRLTNAAQNVYALPDAAVVAIGCCLYLGTGMLLGIPFQLVLGRLGPRSWLIVRLAVASVVSIVIWAILFYGVLSWLQPLLCGGNWITDPAYLPEWVAVGTHLVFGWSMAVLAPWGAYVPYPRPAASPELAAS